MGRSSRVDHMVVANSSIAHSRSPRGVGVSCANNFVISPSFSQNYAGKLLNYLFKNKDLLWIFFAVSIPSETLE